MAEWNVEVFFDRFKTGTLGRKTQYSSYWVNKFNGCEVLCNKSSNRKRRSRAGEHVMGVYMGKELCVFNRDQLGGVYNNYQYLMTINETEDITESGLIDYEVSAGNSTAVAALFQIGHSQYLLEPYWSNKVVRSYEDIVNAPFNKTVNVMEGYPPATSFGATNLTGDKFTGVIKKLPEGKYNSIKEAREALIPEEVKAYPKESFIYKNWWFTPTENYIPNDLTEDEKRLLESPPMPWHYGLTTQVVNPILELPSILEKMTPNIHKHMNSEILKSLQDYSSAKIRYGEIIEKLNNLYVDQDNGSDFDNFFLLPGQSMAYVQMESGEKYHVMGDLRSKNEESFSIR